MIDSKVLVLGSKSDPNIYTIGYGVVIFPNGAICHSDNSLYQSSKKIHILSGFVFKDIESTQVVRELMHGKRPDVTLVINSARMATSDINKECEEIGYYPKHMIVFDKLVFEKSYRLFKRKEYGVGLIRCLFMNKFSRYDKINVLKKYINGSLHLSTGIWCVLYAMCEFPSSEIHVSGIGVFTGGYEYGGGGVRGHELQDYIVFNLLEKQPKENSRVIFQENEVINEFPKLRYPPPS